MQVWNEYLAANKQRFLDELLDLLRIPSVSADSKYKADVARCADAVKTVSYTHLDVYKRQLQT